MECTYCDKPAVTVNQQGEHVLCRFCLALVKAGAWKIVAKQWLKHHPEDWVNDVASFLEHIYSTEE